MAQPEKTFRQGVCSASVFVNGFNKDGKDIEIRKVSLQKGYKDKDGKWQTSNVYTVNDLPKIIVAAGKAYDYLTAKGEE